MASSVIVKGYQVGPKIDHTGMRTMYRGVHIASGRDVFITIIACRAGTSQNALLKRAKQSKRLNHPGLVSAMDYGVLPQDRFFYTHAATPSFPIARVIGDIRDPRERQFTLLKLFIQLLESVDYIHSANATHRDLGTNQIRVTQDNEVLLEGFINARPRTEPKSIVHIVKVPYISPEQLAGHITDTKTDIYSCGVILYELLTGKVPYDSNFSKLEDHKQGIVPSPLEHNQALSKELAQVTMRALSPRKSRYRHIREMIRDLESYYDRRSFPQKLRDFSQSLKNLLRLRKAQ